MKKKYSIKKYSLPIHIPRGKSLLELRESNENLSDGLKNSTRITKAKCKFQTRGAKPRGAGIAFCLSDEGGIFQSMTKIVVVPVVNHQGGIEKFSPRAEFSIP